MRFAGRFPRYGSRLAMGRRSPQDLNNPTRWPGAAYGTVAGVDLSWSSTVDLEPTRRFSPGGVNPIPLFSLMTGLPAVPAFGRPGDF
jgi:hypothetical protein